MQISSSNSIASSQQILQKLFIEQPNNTKSTTETPKKTLRINLKLLKKLSEEYENYRTAIEFILIIQKILFTGKKRLSLRELIYKNSSFRNSEKGSFFSSSFGSSFSSSFGQGFGYRSPKRSKTSLIEDSKQKQLQKSEQTSIKKQAAQLSSIQQSNKKVQLSAKNYQSPIKHIQSPQKAKQIQSAEQIPLFISDQLNTQEKKALSQCLTKIMSGLTHTIYQSKIRLILDQLTVSPNVVKPKNYSEDDNYKKMISLSGLGLDGSKASKIEQFITKGYHTLNGKFTSFQSLYTFLSNQVLPLIQRKIFSISINNHSQRQSFLTKSITFITQYFLHQFTLQIKINKATLIENRTFVQRLFKYNFKNHQSLLTNNLTNIINQALLCPSCSAIQLPLFRLLKRMYLLWSVMPSEQSTNMIQLKTDTESLGQFIKYPLIVNLKNISLYCKPIDNQDQIKEPAMFCYKLLHAKEDLYLCNQIETLSELRFIKESKYFSSKAYAFSEEINKVYDTFDLRMNFFKYYKRVERGEVWTYNILIEKPNSLLIWEFYLQAFDIGFGIYKVQNFKRHTIDQYTLEKQCKEIMKIQKYTVTQGQPQKGFLFLKNGLYRLVFDNSYSNFRGKNLTYMILHLESQN